MNVTGQHYNQSAERLVVAHMTYVTVAGTWSWVVRMLQCDSMTVAGTWSWVVRVLQCDSVTVAGIWS